MAKPTRYTPELIEEYRRKGYWTATTPVDLWDRNARDHPSREAVADPERSLTWAQAKEAIDRLALGLLELGFHRDDMLVSQLPNCVELCLLRVAAEKAGILFLPANRLLRDREMEYILGHTQAVGVVIPWKFRDFDHFAMVEALQGSLPNLKHVIVTGDPVPPGTVSLEGMLHNPLEGKYSPDFLESTKLPATEFSLVGHTTGTTGFPKFVELPISADMYLGRLTIDALRLSTDDALLALTPATVGPNVPVYFSAPQVGARVFMLPVFEAEEALRLCQEERITVLCAVPAMLAMMVECPQLERYDMSSLRVAVSAGASIPYALALAIESKLGCRLTQIYGAMDAGGITRTTLDNPPDARLLTAGRPFPGNEVKLVDASGREVPRGEVGEIMARGPTMDVAYFRDPEATWATWTRDGWRRLGDLGRMDEQGYLSIVGRESDMIIRGGQNIYPAEIEGLLLAHPQVSAAAVVRMPDRVLGERACACIVLKPGGELSFEEMVSFLRGKKIASYKFPERLEVLEELPLAGGQKVDKKALEQDVAGKLKDEGRL